MRLRPHYRRIPATFSACLIAVIATACGSTSPTKKDTVARGNAICSSAVSSARAVVPPANGTGSGAALASYFKQREPIVAKEVSQLRKLPRPSTDEALLNRYIDSVTKAGDVYKLLVSASKRNDINGVAKYLSALHASPAESLALRYGMSQCAAAAAATAP